jgi:hypothetical protein
MLQRGRRLRKSSVLDKDNVKPLISLGGCLNLPVQLLPVILPMTAIIETMQRTATTRLSCPDGLLLLMRMALYSRSPWAWSAGITYPA